MVRKSKGRQKVEMVKMTNERTLQASFSKRRYSLFKKASELCTLCNVEVAIIVFSPGKKVFSFGHPCVESVIEHYLTGNASQSVNSMQPIQGPGNPGTCELNQQLTQILDELEVEKKRGDELMEIRKASQSQFWWEAPIDELHPSHLAELKVRLEALKEKATLQAQKVVMQSSSSEGFLQFHPDNVGFNPSNNDLVPPPPSPLMIQSFAPQNFSGNSSVEGIIPFHQTDYNFNPSSINVMPLAPSAHQQYHPPQHSLPDLDYSGYNPAFNHRLY